MGRSVGGRSVGRKLTNMTRAVSRRVNHGGMSGRSLKFIPTILIPPESIITEICAFVTDYSLETLVTCDRMDSVVEDKL